MLFAGLVCDGGPLQSRGHAAHMVVTSPVGGLSLFPAALAPLICTRSSSATAMRVWVLLPGFPVRQRCGSLQCGLAG